MKFLKFSLIYMRHWEIHFISLGFPLVYVNEWDLVSFRILLCFDILKTLEKKFMVTRGERWYGGIDLEFGTDMYTLLYLK